MGGGYNLNVIVEISSPVKKPAHNKEKITNGDYCMSSASEPEGPQFKPPKKLNIYQIRNDAVTLSFKIYTKLFVYICGWRPHFLGCMSNIQKR